jgi:hypothetical protein
MIYQRNIKLENLISFLEVVVYHQYLIRFKKSKFIHFNQSDYYPSSFIQMFIAALSSKPLQPSYSQLLTK